MITDRPEIEVVTKGWGFEKIITNTDKYCGKLLYIIKGKRCSLHYHINKDETFYIQSGKVKLYYSDDYEAIEQEWGKLMSGGHAPFLAVHMMSQGLLQNTTLKPGDNFYIPPGRVHQMVAIEDTTLFEFSTHHRDDDSHRILKGD